MSRCLRSMVICLAVLLIAGVSGVEGQKPQRIRRPAVNVPRTILRVNTHVGGDQGFQKWGNALVINGPSILQFRWSNNVTGAVAARWVVTDLPLSQAGARVIHTQPLPAIPAPDHLGYFSINFTSFMPATPPDPSYALSYYVYVILSDSAAKDKPPSNHVRITYTRGGTQTQFEDAAIESSPEYCSRILTLAREALKTRFRLFNPDGDIRTGTGIGAYQLFKGVMGGAPASLEVSGQAPNPVIYLGVPEASPRGYGHFFYKWYRFTVDRNNHLVAAPDPAMDVPTGTPPVLPNPGAWSKYGTYNGIPGDDPPHWCPILVKSDPLKIGDLHRGFQVPAYHAAMRQRIEQLGISMANKDLTDRAMESWQSVKLCGFILEAWFTSGDYGLDHTEDYHDGTDAPTGHLHEETDITWAGLDWDMCIVPDLPYNYVASTVRPTVRVEIENFTLGNRFYWPKTYDWLQAVGRWVVDCGHTSYTEIHPPELLVANTPNLTNPYTNWARVNLTGAWQGDTLDFVVYPPPRPSPDARLTYRILRRDGTPGYDRRKNAELVVTPRGTPGNPNYLYCQVVAQGPGPILRYNTGMVGHCGTRGLRCVVECGWEGDSGTVRVAASGTEQATHPHAVPIKGAYLFYRSAEAAASPWEVIRLSDTAGFVSLHLPVGHKFWLRPAGSGWNFAQPALYDPAVPYPLTLARSETKSLLFGAVPDKREITVENLRHFVPYGRIPSIRTEGQTTVFRRPGPDPVAAGNEVLRSALVSLEETGGPFGVKGNNLGYEETAIIYFRLKSLVGDDGQPIRDRESAIQVDSSTTPPSLILRGTPGEGVAGARILARLLLGNEGSGYREAGRVEVRTSREGLARFRVAAGTHVEDAMIAIEVLENPVNPWFLPKVLGSSYLFFPGADTTNAADTAPGRVPYTLTGLTLNREAIQAIMGTRHKSDESAEYLEEMQEMDAFARRALKELKAAKINMRPNSYKLKLKKK